MVAATLASAVKPSFATAQASVMAQEALELCSQARRTSGEEQMVLLSRGLEVAEEAVALDPSNARGHLAVFCNLGRRTDARGMGFESVSALRRLKREIDLAVGLAPEDPDVLAGKGALLLRLPRLLGGSAAAGEELLRRSLILRSANPTARLYLARALAARGAIAAATAEAQRALADAEQAGAAADAADAHELIGEIGGGSITL
jgi:hypothetical protein